MELGDTAEREGSLSPSVGWAGGKALCELALQHCPGGRVWREPEGSTLSWHCHARSEGPQLAWQRSTELFCNVLLTASSCQLWENNQKHRFSTLRKKPECSSAETDLEAELPYGVGCWEVFHEQAVPCAHVEIPCSGHLN